MAGQAHKTFAFLNHRCVPMSPLTNHSQDTNINITDHLGSTCNIQVVMQFPQCPAERWKGLSSEIGRMMTGRSTPGFHLIAVISVEQQELLDPSTHYHYRHHISQS